MKKTIRNLLKELLIHTYENLTFILSGIIFMLNMVPAIRYYVSSLSQGDMHEYVSNIYNTTAEGDIISLFASGMAHGLAFAIVYYALCFCVAYFMFYMVDLVITGLHMFLKKRVEIELKIES